MLDLHVEEQTSVQFLIPKQHGKFLLLHWIYNTRHVVVSYNHKYKDIVKKPWDNAEFNKETLSLTLKSVQKNHSGEYTAKIHTVSTTQIVAHYRIFVQAAVEAPVLIGPSNQSSSDNCNVTVTCRGHDLSLTLNCNSTSCFPRSVTVSAASSLTMSVKSGFVICNHSNQVSWKNITKEIDFQCRTSEDYLLNHIVWTLVIGIAFLCLLIILCVIPRSVNQGFVSAKSEIPESNMKNHLDTDSKGSPKPTRQNTYIPLLRQCAHASLGHSDRDSSNCTVDHDDTTESTSTYTALSDSNEVYMNIRTNRNTASSVSLEGHMAKTDINDNDNDDDNDKLYDDGDDGIYVNGGEFQRVHGCVSTETDIYGASGSNVESENMQVYENFAKFQM